LNQGLIFVVINVLEVTQIKYQGLKT